MADKKPEEEIPKNLPGNSYSNPAKNTPKKNDEERKPIDKVVTGKVVKRKKGFGAKIRETVAGDDARSVGSYIFFDVIIPAAKAMLADAASQGAERLLFGDSRKRSRPSNQGNPQYSSYSRMYGGSSQNSGQRNLSSRDRNVHNFDQIILSSRAESEEVLDGLTTLVEDYGSAKVSDLYQLVGITGNYIDDKWGWTDLRQASTSQVREGFLLDLPRPILLD